MATMPNSLATLEQIMGRHIGHYNGHISWYLQCVAEPTAERVADMIESRDSQALRHMTGREGWIKDRDNWWPILVEACSAMLAELNEAAWAEAMVTA